MRKWETAFFFFLVFLSIVNGSPGCFLRYINHHLPNLQPPHKSHPGEPAVSRKSQVKHLWHFTRCQYRVCQIQSSITSSLETLVFPSKDLILLDLTAGAVKFLLPYRSPFSYSFVKQPQLSSILSNNSKRKWPTAARCQWSCGAQHGIWPPGPWGLRCRIIAPFQERAEKELKKTLWNLENRECLLWFHSLYLARLFLVGIRGTDAQTKKGTWIEETPNKRSNFPSVPVRRKDVDWDFWGVSPHRSQKLN